MGRFYISFFYSFHIIPFNICYLKFLGDSGYLLEPWLMTPLLQAQSNSELLYNRKHSQARSIIEQCNGLLKNRWRCLLKHRMLHYHPEVASNIVVSCVVLHNMCIHHKIGESDIEVEEPEEMGPSFIENNECSITSEARHLQKQLIASCFQ